MFRYIHSAVSPIWQRTSYRYLLFQATGGFLALVYLAVPGTLVLFNVAQVAVWVLAPLLLVVSGFSSALRNSERKRVNQVLGINIPAPPTSRQSCGSPEQRIGQIRGWLTDPVAKRAVFWLAARTLFGLMVLSTTTSLMLTVAEVLRTSFEAGLPSVIGWATIRPIALTGFVGVLSLIAVAHLANMSMSFHAGLAEPLLGPSDAERLVALQQRTDQLAERTRLARELHDSVGHTLTVIVMQAAAARRKLATDPTYVRQALAIMEDTGCTALDELDRMLYILREEETQRPVQQPGLGDIEALFDRLRSLGLPLTTTVSGDLSSVPTPLGVQVHRIVQEGSTNVLRHAGLVPTVVIIEVSDNHLEVIVSNESSVTPSSSKGAPSGRRGLRGVKERVHAAGGLFDAGPTSEGGYRLRILLPL